MKSLHIETPVYQSLRLAKSVGKPVYLKMECLQPVGSFKIRGLGKLCQEYYAQGKRHFVSSSGGNAGYASAYAGRQLGVDVTVFVPTTTKPLYIDRMEEQGATVHIEGDVWDESHKAAMAFNKEIKGAYIPPFDHPTIWSGYTTLIDECVKQCPKPGAIVVAVGGGGLLSGILEGMYRHSWQDVPIVAVETTGSASLAACIHAKRHVSLDRIDTIATTLGAKRVADRAYEWTTRHPITSVVVEDEATVRAIHRFADDRRVFVEPACGAPLALVYDNHQALANVKSLLIIICGGIGISIELLAQYQEQFGV